MTFCCTKCGLPVTKCTCFNLTREQIISLYNKIDELEIENSRLRNTDIYVIENNNYKEQIEAMKCFGNCENNTVKCLDKNCYGCTNWRLAK